MHSVRSCVRACLRRRVSVRLENLSASRYSLQTTGRLHASSFRRETITSIPRPPPTAVQDSTENLENIALADTCEPPNPTFVHALSQYMPDLTSFGEPAILQRLLRHRLYVLSLLTAPSERHVESVAYNHSRCE